MTYLQSLDKALNSFIEFKFCESDFYFLNGNKNCMVATYNFGSVYIGYSTYTTQFFVVMKGHIAYIENHFGAKEIFK